jgi:hypothetical protein
MFDSEVETDNLMQAMREAAGLPTMGKRLPHLRIHGKQKLPPGPHV